MNSVLLLISKKFPVERTEDWVGCMITCWLKREPKLGHDAIVNCLHTGTGEAKANRTGYYICGYGRDLDAGKWYIRLWRAKG